MPGEQLQISHGWLYVLQEIMENTKTALNLSSTVNLPHTNPKTPRLIHSHNDFAIFSCSLLLSTSITSSLYSSLSAITLDILPKWDESKGRGEERHRGPHQLLGNQNAIVLHKWKVHVVKSDNSGCVIPLWKANWSSCLNTACKMARIQDIKCCRRTWGGVIYDKQF